MSNADIMREDLLKMAAEEAAKSGMSKEFALLKFYCESPKLFRFEEQARASEGKPAQQLVEKMNSQELFKHISAHVRQVANDRGITLRASWREFHEKHSTMWTAYEKLQQSESLSGR